MFTTGTGTGTARSSTTTTPTTAATPTAAGNGKQHHHPHPHHPHTGYIGNLTSKQQVVYDKVHAGIHKEWLSYIEYKEQITGKRYEHQQGHKDKGLQWKGSDEQKKWLQWEHDDIPYMLCRYGRARRWKSDQIIRDIRTTIEWRKSAKVDYILDEPTKDEVRKIAPTSEAECVSKIGEPIYFELSGKINIDGILNWMSLTECIDRHIYVQEKLCERMRTESQHRADGSHVETNLIIQDLTGISLQVRKILYVLKEFIHIDLAHYPERMGRTYVLNGPWFLPILWSIVKVWMDQRTREKIVFVSQKDVFTALSRVIDVDQIPTVFGGTANIPLRGYTNAELQQLGIDVTKRRSDGKSSAVNGTDSSVDDSPVTTQITVAAGKKIERSITSPDKSKRTMFGYDIKVSANDISVSIIFTPFPVHRTSSRGDGTIPSHNEVVVLAPSKLSGEYSGEYESAVAGTLRVILDNTYSYMTSKVIDLGLNVSDVDTVASSSSRESDNDNENETGTGRERNEAT